MAVTENDGSCDYEGFDTRAYIQSSDDDSDGYIAQCNCLETFEASTYEECLAWMNEHRPGDRASEETSS